MRHFNPRLLEPWFSFNVTLGHFRSPYGFVPGSTPGWFNKGLQTLPRDEKGWLNFSYSRMGRPRRSKELDAMVLLSDVCLQRCQGGKY